VSYHALFFAHLYRAFLLRSAEHADDLVAASHERIQNALAKCLLSNDRDAHDRIPAV
jgi:hypothetical protein